MIILGLLEDVFDKLKGNPGFFKHEYARESPNFRRDLSVKWFKSSLETLKLIEKQLLHTQFALL